MKKRILTLVLALSLAFTLAACTTKEENPPPEKPPVEKPPVENPDNTPEPPQTPSDELSRIYGYMGKADEDVVKQYGEGKTVMGQDDKIAGREYRMQLFGMDMPVVVNYNAEGMVESFHLSSTDMTREKWTETLNEEYGEAKMENDLPKWAKDGMIFTFGEKDGNTHVILGK